MGFFRKKKEAGAAATPQIKRVDAHPFAMLGSYVPLRQGEARLYRAIREAVPLVDACIYKIIRLCGGVTAECSDPGASRELKQFIESGQAYGASQVEVRTSSLGPHIGAIGAASNVLNLFLRDGAVYDRRQAESL